MNFSWCDADRFELIESTKDRGPGDWVEERAVEGDIFLEDFGKIVLKRLFWKIEFFERFFKVWLK